MTVVWDKLRQRLNAPEDNPIVRRRILSGSLWWLWAFTLMGVVGIIFSAMEPRSIAEIRYIVAGLNLAHGEGMIIPGPLNWHANGSVETFTHGPPMLVLWVALGEVAGPGWYTGIKLLNSILFMATASLIYLILVRLVNRQRMAVIGALTYMSFPLIGTTFFMVTTEAIFLPLLMLHFYLFFVYMDHPGRWQVVWMGLVGMLAFLTRYSAAPLLLSSALFILWYRGRENWRAGLLDTALYSVIAGLPTVLFLLVDYLTSSAVGNRDVVYRTIGSDKVIIIVTLFLFGQLLFYLIWSELRHRVDIPHVIQFVGILHLFLVVYIVFIVFVGMFLDKLTMAARLMMPLFFVYIVCITLYFYLLQGRSRLLLSPLLVVAGLMMLIFTGYVLNQPYQFFTAEADNQVFDYPVYRDELPDDVIVYSNKPDKVSLYFDVADPYAVPLLFDPHTFNENTALETDLAVLRDHLQTCEAVIVHYDTRLRRYVLNGPELFEDLMLDLASRPVGNVKMYYDRACDF